MALSPEFATVIVFAPIGLLAIGIFTLAKDTLNAGIQKVMGGSGGGGHTAKPKGGGGHL
jgi:hypothetical protein